MRLGTSGRWVGTRTGAGITATLVQSVFRVIKTRRLRWTDKPSGKRPIWRARDRWEDNIRMGLKEICVNTGNWVDGVSHGVR